ncbi:MAG: ribonuclease [Lachnospiraceae bacterium]|nr:ribonuclease [Lachnospiraceae bacterium]
MKKHKLCLISLLLGVVLFALGIAGCRTIVYDTGTTTEIETAVFETVAEPSGKEAEADTTSPAIVKEETTTEPFSEEDELTVSEDGEYTSKDEVALYLHLYGHLPSNFITKNQAKKLGWVSSEGNLGKVAPGKSIGGDYFGNFEGNLPEKKGRDYYECDIDSTGGYRGAKRIIYSNDGLIYYTEDHYNTFTLLYGEEG